MWNVAPAIGELRYSTERKNGGYSSSSGAILAEHEDVRPVELAQVGEDVVVARVGRPRPNTKK